MRIVILDWENKLPAGMRFEWFLELPARGAVVGGWTGDRDVAEREAQRLRGDLEAAGISLEVFTSYTTSIPT